MPRPEKPRDIIFREIVRTYARDIDPGRVDWWYSKGYTADVARSCTTEILSHIVNAGLDHDDNWGDFYRRTLFSECHNVIWMTFPGGSTAEGCTERIFKALGLRLPEDD